MKSWPKSQQHKLDGSQDKTGKNTSSSQEKGTVATPSLLKLLKNVDLPKFWLFCGLLQKKSDVYSVEIYGTKDLHKTEIEDEEEKHKDLKGNKKKKKAEDLKKELDLVSVAELPLLIPWNPGNVLHWKAWHRDLPPHTPGVWQKNAVRD